MISSIFIARPIFAWVIAIVIMLAGVAAMRTLPVEQYPDIAPPQVNIRTTFTGASAEVLEASVTQVIEQELTGLDGMLYFQATSSSSGQVSITVTFEKGVDPDIAEVQVQNEVQQALRRLPQEVQQQGVVVTKSNPDFLMVAAIYDASDRSSSGDVADYLVSNLQEPIGRIAGVGDVSVFGSQYAMRIWLDPYRLASFSLTPDDVIAALNAQNTEVAAGQIGAQPSSDGQMLSAQVTARSRLTTPEEFREILVKTSADGSRVLLRDVARVELGSESYATISRLDGHPASGIAVSLSPGADALRTAGLVRKALEAQAHSFPPGYRYDYPYDTTAFIKLSVREVVVTLLIAIVLVVVVMFVFLQSWQATLIPAIAVPVVLLGSFGVLALVGFSINVLTLFGLVLSIGLLVDDAIVVVENVERVLAEEPGLSPAEATRKSMAQVQTALIAIALVLSAVFLPMALFGGSVGVIYRQFSVTIVTAMALSVLVALVLSPALASRLLKAPREPRGRGLARLVARLGELFNTGLAHASDRYRTAVAFVIARTRLALVAYAAVVGVLVAVFLALPTSFLPAEDQGGALLQFTLPPGATQPRTLAAAQEIERYFMGRERADLDAIYTVVGQGVSGTGQNAGRGFIALKPWRQRGHDTAQVITRRANAVLGAMRDVQFFALNPPPVRGLGQSSGFTMELLNTGGLTRDRFRAARDRLMAAANADPVLSDVRLTALPDNPSLNVVIDPQAVGALGLAQDAVDSTLTAAWGGIYVDDFVDRGRVKRVFVQGDAAYRSRPEDLGAWYVRGADGGMAPFSAFARTVWGQSPTTLERFNGASSYEIQGDAAAGRSTGEAMTRLTHIASQLPGTSVAWSGLSYQERLSGGQAPLLYAISLLVVFLCLAALYESWSVPISVMLVIPLGLVGAALAVWARGLANDVYFQVGLLTTMGLSAKNAILIVEFAQAGEKRGLAPKEAALEAARLRLRPILMTSFAFIFGVAPLAMATGAGAQSRIAIGTAVLGGTFTATVLAIFLVPMFYVLVRRVFGRGKARAAEPAP